MFRRVAPLEPVLNPVAKLLFRHFLSGGGLSAHGKGLDQLFIGLSGARVSTGGRIGVRGNSWILYLG
jgi:hypothetical protein